MLHWQGEHPLQRMIHGTFGGEDSTLGDGSIQGLDVSPYASEMCTRCHKCLAAGLIWLLGTAQAARALGFLMCARFVCIG